jgi:hypothetical protein
MLTLFLTHIIITATCFWTGFLFYKYILRKNETQQTIFCFITGLIFLTLLVQLLVLFIPLDFYVHIGLALILLISAIVKWKEFRQAFQFLLNEIKALTILSKSLFFILWIMLLLINAGPALMDDTDSYHIQMTKWIQEYGSVPGIANLHERFGFNSSWFSSVAFFSFSSDTTGGYTALNGVLSLWFCYYLLFGFSRFVKTNLFPAAISFLVLLAFSLAVWPMTRGNAATANYDFIAIVLVLILFLESFLSKETDAALSVEWLIWPVYLFTVRIINFPFLLLSTFVLIFLYRKKMLTNYLLPLACCLLLIIPFLVRNIIVSGYPFYPSTYFNFFSVDWEANPLMMEDLLRFIKYYGRVNTTYMDIKQTEALGFPGWIPVWFRYLFSFDKATLLVGFTGLIGSALLLFTKRFKQNKQQIFFLLVIITWLVCWFFISPDPRFVYGCLLAGVFLLSFYFISFFKINTLTRSFTNVFLITLIAAAGYYTIIKPIRQKEYRNWVNAAKLPQPPVKKVLVDGLTLNIPEPINNNWNARCYGTSLPCLYYLDPKLKARGINIRNGFRLEK